MKLFIAIFSLITLIANPLMAAAAQLKAENIEGWEVREIDKMSWVADFLAGADLVLSQKVPDPENPGAHIRVHKRQFDKTELLTKSEQTWRAVVFKKNKNTTKALKDRTVKKDGQWRYFAEYQTDVGMDYMLHTAIMASVVEGQLYIAIYEQYPEYYKKESAAVKKLMREMKLTVQ